MPTYITLMKLTDQGAKDIKNAPNRVRSAVKLWEMLGGKTLGVYLTMGDNGYVSIGEGPNDEAAISFSLTLTSRENVKTTTLRAFTAEAFTEMVKKLLSRVA